MNQLKLGLPKGSLEKATFDLFENAGWLIKPAKEGNILAAAEKVMT